VWWLVCAGIIYQYQYRHNKIYILKFRQFKV